MKGLLRHATAAFVSVALLSIGTTGQNKMKMDDEQRARGMFVNKKADAMRILVLRAEDGKLVPADPSQEFAQGDQIKLTFESNFEGYVYVVNVTPGGKKCVLFPYSNQSDNTVRSGRRYDLPPANDVLEFDAEKGVEVLQVIMSRERVPSLDQALKESGGCMGESASSAAAELAATGVVRDKITPAFSTGGIRARNIILAPGKDKDQEGTVVAIAEPTGGGKLKGKEAAIFEIRLKHN